jgi:hypothetical protein
MESKDQWGNYVTWYDYRLNPLISGNIKAIKKMKEYVEKNS